ncbi:uncharacterized protein (DUF1015 family) [Roseivirga ehrenbergii]|uniref:DUF1015 domain-containing protein n=2 Tax=Roseivirga TaxID=290180 RepID=A0A150X6M1_ROSEK|nr:MULTISPECIES: DUF1015 domain-containing protein [Roseivirga]KYG74377.1 hypothetical protein MB14_03965 [Roseivirga ehrenbergii]KYG79753.1 hypothetical protein AWW67_10555 [Roseivirga seohaensis]TCL14324.1 uncharacterized protein (DUF1015 family) [Roseivirga ehrenbergii]
MARIKPFRAWRYNRELSNKIEDLASPLFDVVSKKQREALYNNPYNSIHISVPRDIETQKRTVEEWKAEGIINQDQIPGIYVYYQHFTLPGSRRTYIRKGFICFIEATDWNSVDSDVLRHENTMPHSVNDRIDILAQSQMNVSPTHGLYFDPEFSLEQYMDESMKNPIYDREDYQGVRDVLSVIHDFEVIKKFVAKLKDQQVILADGHHRYEGSLLYKQRMKAQNPNHTGNEAYNFHLMYLTNAEADDLRILPTHRLLSGLKNFNKEDLLNTLSEDFIIKPLDNPNDVNEIILGKKWAFGLLFGKEAVKVRLKPERITELKWNFPQVVKDLDLTVMHYFIIEKALGILGKDQRSSEHISFERNFSNCLEKTITGEVDFAIITQDISMEDVKNVCHSGYTLPQKSTYFYPKVISGYLFGSIKEDEFTLPFDIGF